MRVFGRSSLRTFLSFFLFSSIAYADGTSSRLGYECAEHDSAGNDVVLRFSQGDTGVTGAQLHLPNGLTLSYGEALTMGDFYEIVDNPVSETVVDSAQRYRFMNAFNSLAQDANTPNEATQILAVVNNEMALIQQGIEKGEDPEEIYANIGDDDNRQFNCITGGGCDTVWWLNAGRFLNLAKKDIDHFGDGAITTYKIGHELAMGEAVMARETHDRTHLEFAYAMNAFASHFLSDRFSAGHIRTPRVQLMNSVTPSVVGSLLVKYMHNEENRFGLHLHNQRGDHWIGYGDRFYFEDKNKDNRDKLHEALQLSADEIFAAYITGVTTKPDKVLDLIPVPDETPATAKEDIAPLFYWDEATQKVWRRVDMTNVYDNEWTDNWWGWSTLSALSEQRGLPNHMQATLATSEVASAAWTLGLITDPACQAYVKNHQS